MKPDARTAREHGETAVQEAKKLTDLLRRGGPGWLLFAEKMPDVFDGALDALVAQVERLERERDEARQKLDKLIHAVKHDTIPNSTIYQRQAEAAEARAQRYREALTTCAEEGSVGARRALSADPLVCRDPDLCWGTGTCPRDPACNE